MGHSLFRVDDLHLVIFVHIPIGAPKVTQHKCVCVCMCARERDGPFVQDLQLEALGLHHPPEAAVVAVDGQREALVVFWGSRSMANTSITRPPCW